MNKVVRTVFGILATLVVIFLLWTVVFADADSGSGVLKTAYNSLANGVNTQWSNVAGEDEELLPIWSSTATISRPTSFDIPICVD